MTKTSRVAGVDGLVFSNICDVARNLGSIYLAKFYDPEKRMDWDRLREVTHLCTRFLDNVIDTCAWPLPEINDVVKRTRPLGLGIMGFADLCLNLKITYGSPASIDLMDEVMGFVRREAWNESLRLGAERGARDPPRRLEFAGAALHAVRSRPVRRSRRRNSGSTRSRSLP